MVVKFQPAPFKPGNRTHYLPLREIPGIYVYGLRLLIDGSIKFVPLYIGISVDLEHSLLKHYRDQKTGGNSCNELFNLNGRSSVASIKALYADMKMYDSFSTIPQHPKRLSIPSLIWFNAAAFFNWRLAPSISTYKANSGVMNSIKPDGDLDKIGTTAALKLKKDIEDSKALFDDNFYFIYARLSTDVHIPNTHQIFIPDYRSCRYLIGRANGPGKNICEAIELATKKAFSCHLGIHSTANAVGTLHPMEIDISTIQHDLVNVGGHNFGNPYIHPLIIRV